MLDQYNNFYKERSASRERRTRPNDMERHDNKENNRATVNKNNQKANDIIQGPNMTNYNRAKPQKSMPNQVSGN